MIPDVIFDPLIFEIPEAFETIRRPWTLRPVRVPTLVMLDCAAAVTLRAVGTVVTFEPLMFESTFPPPTKKVAEMFPVE
jgi:hypothetical protein